MSFVVASRGRRRRSVNDPDSERTTESRSLTLDQRLEPSNVNLLNADSETIHDMETLHACVGYENANQQRTHILERLVRRGVRSALTTSEPLWVICRVPKQG